MGGIEEMVVTFCGHRQVAQREKVEQWLRCVMVNLLQKGATTFYLGAYGDFDSMTASILREYKQSQPQIELIRVLAYPPRGQEGIGYDGTVYPPLETIPRRFAITYRNRWMVEASDVVVAYVLHAGGGAAATLRYAKQKRKVIIPFLPEQK